MNQLSLIPPRDLSSLELQQALIKTLLHGGWRHRDDLALQLNVSVRAIRDAASQSKGQILSGQNGLKLTVCATPEEVEDALGRLTSQISEMTTRAVQTRNVFQTRLQKSA